MRKTRRSNRPVSIYDLLDRYSPRYQETKPGSSEYGAAVLAVYPLTDGRFVWQTAYTRQRFADGQRADWWIGNSPASGADAQVSPSFADALAAARADLAQRPLPQWAN